MEKKKKEIPSKVAWLENVKVKNCQTTVAVYKEINKKTIYEKKENQIAWNDNRLKNWLVKNSEISKKKKKKKKNFLTNPVRIKWK